MLTALFWIGLAMEIMLTARLIAGRLFARYPFFFAHVCSVLAVTIAFYALILSDPQLYGRCYWIGQLLTMITGCGIILEILTHVLWPDAGTRRYAMALRWILYLAVGGIVTIYLWTPAILRDSVDNLNIERDFRSVQSFLLLAALALIFRRSLVMGRNMKGMFLGYGIYVAASLVILAVRSYAGPVAQHAWQIAQPFSYLVCVLIWLCAMWAYYPGPSATVAVRSSDDRDFEVVRT
jgi:hypothetical protein